MPVLDDARMLSAYGCSRPVIVGDSPRIRQVTDLARRIARSDTEVLITGESGVGKEQLARFIHSSSPRSAYPFVPLRCGGAMDDDLESELCGSRASTPVDISIRTGKLFIADHGTLFIDEVGELPPRSQAALLRFLETSHTHATGSDGPPNTADVRIIATTSCDLPAMVAQGTFDEALLYRLRVAQLHVPSLRDRREDILGLISHAADQSGYLVRLSADAMRALERYHWPGNVRELESLVGHLAAVCPNGEVRLADLPEALTESDRPTLTPVRERRARVGDEIFDALTAGHWTFWEHVYPMFIRRDLTRADLRHVISRALAATGGHYRGVLRLFHMPDSQYKRFLNFLASHGCRLDFRVYRGGLTSRADTDPAFEPEGASGPEDVVGQP